jgi:hypothetical protein
MKLEPDYERRLNTWIPSLNKPHFPDGVYVETRDNKGVQVWSCIQSTMIPTALWVRYNLTHYRIVKV